MAEPSIDTQAVASAAASSAAMTPPAMIGNATATEPQPDTAADAAAAQAAQQAAAVNDPQGPVADRLGAFKLAMRDKLDTILRPAKGPLPNVSGSRRNGRDGDGDVGAEELPTLIEFLRRDPGWAGTSVSKSNHSTRDVRRRQARCLCSGDLVRARIVGQVGGGGGSSSRHNNSNGSGHGDADLVLAVDSIAQPMAGNKTVALPIIRDHLKMRAVCVMQDALDAANGRRGDLEPGNELLAVVAHVDEANKRIQLSCNANLLLSDHQEIRLGPLVDEPPRVYWDMLRANKAIKNPFWMDMLRAKFELDDSASLRSELHNAPAYPTADYCDHLRKAQESKCSADLVTTGVHHQKAGRAREAFNCYAQALSVNPKNTNALVARGALCTTREDFASALKDLRRALELDPQHRNAKNYLETTYLRRGAKLEAEDKLPDACGDFHSAFSLDGPKRQTAMENMKRIKDKLERQVMLARSSQAAARAAYGFGANATGAAGGSDDLSSLNPRDRRCLESMRNLFSAGADAVARRGQRQQQHQRHHRARGDRHSEGYSGSDVEVISSDVSDGSHDSRDGHRQHSSSRSRRHRRRRAEGDHHYDDNDGNSNNDGDHHRRRREDHHRFQADRHHRKKRSKSKKKKGSERSSSPTREDGGHSRRKKHKRSRRE
eukprot:m.45225 g.45225  ORF g.45225 m.45225 type:complete len:660 (+) comp11765_c0_seq2:492-2471(+)